MDMPLTTFRSRNPSKSKHVCAQSPVDRYIANYCWSHTVRDMTFAYYSHFGCARDSSPTIKPYLLLIISTTMRVTHAAPSIYLIKSIKMRHTADSRPTLSARISNVGRGANRSKYTRWPRNHTPDNPHFHVDRYLTEEKKNGVNHTRKTRVAVSTFRGTHISGYFAHFWSPDAVNMFINNTINILRLA